MSRKLHRAHQQLRQGGPPTGAARAKNNAPHCVEINNGPQRPFKKDVTGFMNLWLREIPLPNKKRAQSLKNRPNRTMFAHKKVNGTVEST